MALGSGMEGASSRLPYSCESQLTTFFSKGTIKKLNREGKISKLQNMS
jgi:hypothetical protein